MKCRTRGLTWTALSAVLMGVWHGAHAADHLDTPSVIADPASDIGDVFAWTSPDGRRLNLILTMVAHRFSDQLQYVFHVDSGVRFAETTATTAVVCRFDAANRVECWAGDADHVRGDASQPAGLDGAKRRFRVFAGLRDDPFFNNVRGSREALDHASAALRSGVASDAAGCPQFDAVTSQDIFTRWRHTQGGPATNFLAAWTPATLVISIDLDVVDAGGRLLAVWAAVHRVAPVSSRPVQGSSAASRPPELGAPVERMGRALTANALLGLFAGNERSNSLKEEYNRAGREAWVQFAPEIERGLALYDGFDGRCGNQWLADRELVPARYATLARVLVDDRLWVDADSTVCTQYLAVELVTLSGRSLGRDCGGRTPNHDAVDLFRSLLALGETSGLEDGIARDERQHSLGDFPFLAAP